MSPRLRVIEPDGSSHPAAACLIEGDLRRLLKRRMKFEAAIHRLDAQLIVARERYCEKHKFLVRPHFDALRRELVVAECK